MIHICEPALWLEFEANYIFNQGAWIVLTSTYFKSTKSAITKTFRKCIYSTKIFAFFKQRCPVWKMSIFYILSQDSFSNNFSNASYENHHHQSVINIRFFSLWNPLSSPTVIFVYPPAARNNPLVFHIIIEQLRIFDEFGTQKANTSTWKGV